MFGFLRLSRKHTAARQAYARCCQIQKSLYGISTLPGLSYEATALYLLCIDAGLAAELHPEEPTCCRLKVRPATIQQDRHNIGRYCVSAGILLASVKVEDDIRDSWSPIPRLLHWWYQPKFNKAKQTIEQHRSGTLSKLKSHIEAHLKLESDRQGELEEYLTPTSDAFGELFAAVANNTQHQDLFQTIGRKVGASIIAFDCAADWWSDARRGLFNPIRKRDSADQALMLSADFLCDAAAICRHSFGVNSESARLFTTRAESLLKRTTTPSMIHAELERHGCDREPGYSYAYCDGCDCGGCDGCIDCGFDGCGCIDCACGTGLEACCDSFECCFEQGKEEKSKNQATKSNLQAESAVENKIIGQHGKVITGLNPSGVIEIDGTRHTATAQHGFIDRGIEVVVVDISRFGLIVVSIDHKSDQ